MGISKLGLEYLETAKALRRYVSGLEKELVNLNGVDNIVMKRRISCLKDDIKNCSQIGRWLIKYYRKE